MTRPPTADRITPWLLLGAFVLTLSSLAMRDRLDRPQPLLPEPAAMPVLVLSP